MFRVLSLLLLMTSTAHAARGEAIVSAEPGYVVGWGEGDLRQGFLGTLGIWWGVDDFAWLAASTSAGVLSDDAGRADAVVEALAGAALSLDVFRWVPWTELLIGAAGPSDDLGATGRFGVGVDYLLSPRWALGPALRIRPTPAADDLGGGVSLQIRISRRFEL